MNLREIAEIYTDLVKAEEEIPNEEYRAKEELNALRTKYHEIFMAKMREENVEFSDRFDATRKAFELVRSLSA
ncbi:MAG: hypothetical protein HY540_05550 [Deltaproteobacteria bacterium]|nr:hypothetical protein [Deltaproteobacteria bacterium]